MAVNRTYENAPPPEGEYEEIQLEPPTSHGDYEHPYDLPVTGDHVTQDPDHEYAHIRRQVKRNPCRPVSRKALIVICVVSVVVVGAAVGAAVWFIPRTSDNIRCVRKPCLQGGTCQEGVSGYTCQCPPGYGGPNCQGFQVAFTAWLPTSTNLTTSWRRVEYKKTRTDFGGAYRDSTFYTPSSDLYFVAMSVVTRAYGRYRLVGAPRSLGLTATSTNLGGRTPGRACILQIASEREIHTERRGNFAHNFYTTWSMFSLTAAFHPLVAFTVTKTTPTTALGKVTYRESLINIGDGYRPADSHFVAPYNGSYYFTVSAAVAAGQKARLHIVKNNVREVELLRTDTTHNGTEMISSAAIVKLSRGDRVYVKLVEGAMYSGPEFRETSFSGFLYRPVHYQSIAWSVGRTSSWTTKGSHLSPVPFDTVLVNEGGVYNTSQHVVTVPVSGVYCVHLVAGAVGGRKMAVHIRANISTSAWINVASVHDHNPGRNGETTVSQSVLLTLEAGDVVWVVALGHPGWGLYSNPGLVTGFSGFLVYPT